jgi:tRNA(Ile2) C34 agmatinyltransferase TiaS
MFKLVLTAPDGNVTENFQPACLAERVAESFRKKGYSVEVIDTRATQQRHVPINEQLAAHLSMQEEKHPYRTCPDCGHTMEYDGTWYCEYCEG